VIRFNKDKFRGYADIDILKGSKMDFVQNYNPIISLSLVLLFLFRYD
jgi:hypothetical protein